MKKIAFLLSSILAISVISLIVIYTWDPLTPNCIKCLPTTASDIQDSYTDDGFHGDFVRYLKAKISEGDFHKYAKKLGGFNKYNAKDEEHNSYINDTLNPPYWWTPPSDNTLSYIDVYKKDGRARGVSTLKYHNGFMYFYACTW